MIAGTKQGADNITDSTINQASGDMVIHNHYGMTVEKAKTLLDELMREEIVKYTQLAAEMVTGRLHEAINKTTDRILKEDPSLFARFQTPAIQFALNATYKEYVKTDDKQLGDGLIDLLLDRLKVGERTTEQLLIDEAIQLLPKLSKVQLDFITLFTYDSIKFDTTSYDDFLQKISVVDSCLPSMQNITAKDFDYLKYISCFTATQGLTFEKNRLESYKKAYKVIFSKGTPIKEIEERISVIPKEKITHLMYESPHVKGNYTVAAANDNGFERLIRERGLDTHRALLKDIFDSNIMTDAEIKGWFISKNPNWNLFFDMFTNDKKLKELQLTQISKYIGLKNLSKLAGTSLPFDTWYL